MGSIQWRLMEESISLASEFGCSVLVEAFGDTEAFSNRKLELVETDEAEFIFVDGEPILFRIEGKIFPTVKGALKLAPSRRRVVDKPESSSLEMQKKEGRDTGYRGCQ